MLDGFHFEVFGRKELIQCSEVEDWTKFSRFLGDGKERTCKAWPTCVLDRPLGHQIGHFFVHDLHHFLRPWVSWRM